MRADVSRGATRAAMSRWRPRSRPANHVIRDTFTVLDATRWTEGSLRGLARGHSNRTSLALTIQSCTAIWREPVQTRNGRSRTSHKTAERPHPRQGARPPENRHLLMFTDEGTLTSPASVLLG